MKPTLALAALAALVLSGSALADAGGDPFTGGNAEAGKAKAAVCAACHGPEGNSGNPAWPSLAGQHARYTVEQLQRYKSGGRQDPLMNAQAAALSEQDMKDLAAYFSAQASRPGVGSPDSLKIADPLFRNGDAARGLASCSSCHGPRGAGNAGAGYPDIGGQHATYLAKALRDYRSAKDGSVNVQTMAAIAARLTDAEIDALASYLNGLH